MPLESTPPQAKSQDAELRPTLRMTRSRSQKVAALPSNANDEQQDLQADQAQQCGESEAGKACRRASSRMPARAPLSEVHLEDVQAPQPAARELNETEEIPSCSEVPDCNQQDKASCISAEASEQAPGKTSALTCS